MSLPQRVPFTKDLRGFMGPSASRVSRALKPLSTRPIDPIDQVFAAIPENQEYEASDRYYGFNGVTRQLLARDAFDSLLQIQSEMLYMDDAPFAAPENYSGKAASAYRQAYLAGTDW